MAEAKRLYRSRESRMVAGVRGGIAEYFDLDPTVVRVGFILVSLLTVAFPGLLAYLIMMIVISERPTG
jgi:phage shock protein C